MPKGLKGVNLPDAAAHTCLSNHVTHVALAPKALFDIGKINKDNHTSRWSVVQKHMPLISDLLDSSQGRVPKQASFLEQFIAWLGNLGIVWAWKDADRAIQHLRCMIRSLASLSASSPAIAPKAYPQLQILIDKIVSARHAAKTSDVAIVPIVPKKARTSIHVDTSDSDDIGHEIFGDTSDSSSIISTPITKRPMSTSGSIVPSSSSSMSASSSIKATRPIASCYSRFSSLKSHFSESPAAVPEPPELKLPLPEPKHPLKRLKQTKPADLQHIEDEVAVPNKAAVPVKAKKRWTHHYLHP